MLHPIVKHTVIHLIRQTQHIKFLTQLGDLLQLLARKDFANGVVRGVDDDRLGLVAECRAQLFEVDRPVCTGFDALGIGRRVERDVDGCGALEADRGKVLVEKGFEEDDFFSGIDVRDERGVGTWTSASSVKCRACNSASGRSLGDHLDRSWRSRVCSIRTMCPR